MEISNKVMGVIIEAIRPGAELTAEFERATAWIPEDDPSRTMNSMDLGTMWYLLAGATAKLHNSSIQDIRMMVGIIDLAKRHRYEVIRPYLDAGHIDFELIDRSIAEGVDIELLSSLENGR